MEKSTKENPEKVPVTTNTDRLLPRGYQRKRKSSLGEKCESKKSREGEEEMRKLQSLVPSLRDFESGLSQVDIIEETISYIDQLHKRIAERLVSSGNSSQVRIKNVIYVKPTYFYFRRLNPHLLPLNI